MVYVLCLPVSWRSKEQKSITFLSLEAAGVALLKVVKELMFVIQLLRSIKILANLSMVLWVDNIAAIFIAGHITPTSCNKLVDNRYKYVYQYVKNWIVKIVFGESAENDIDIFAMNLSWELYSKCAKHASNITDKKLGRFSTLRNIHKL